MHLSYIRSLFIEYFKKNGHTHVPSSPLIPHNDPTLMFVNSGMVQFKDVFIGSETRPYSRATTFQKCVRAGGKHNDLDNVGYTARHHTFFEMLGNFSFGDYFKEQAIYYGWDFVTHELGLDPKRLIVTVYQDDTEAYDLWRKIAGIPTAQIIPINTSDNFWSMGDTGPCGPCSEIFYDHGDTIFGGPPGSVDADGDRFVEIWNLVFMQYVQHSDGSRTLLPKPSVDTGMGLERVAAVLQGVHSNFEIDVFKELINLSQKLTHNWGEIHSHHVISDHIRTCAFLIADGVLPSNDGRGYVLRRIMRRAMRHGYSLGAKDPLLHHLVDLVVTLMGESYPELIRAKPLITNTLLQEEERFRMTLANGLRLLDDSLESVPLNGVLPGDIAFKLYDTFGFPLDLTADILKGKKRTVDTIQFDACMTEQKKRGRLNWNGSGASVSETLWRDLAQIHPPTEFLGYTDLTGHGTVLEILNTSGDPLPCTDWNETNYLLIVSHTPIYGESGGQVGDHGLFNTQNSKGRIVECERKNGLFVHHITLDQGILTKGDHIILTVDRKRRAQIEIHHSSTHLLHSALRTILGPHVTQRGSLVDSNRLRFDFTHSKAVSLDEINATEELVNEWIIQNHPQVQKITSLEAAIQEGVIALFGEKYTNKVRSIQFGMASKELCGGTHVPSTGVIGAFKIISQSSVSSGIRRIEAVAGHSLLGYFLKKEETQAAHIHELTAKIHLLQKSRVQDSCLNKPEDAFSLIHKTVSNIHHGSVPIYFGVSKTLEFKQLKPAMDHFKILHTGIIILGSVQGDKISVVIGVTGEYIQKFNAVQIIRHAISVLGGTQGGGRPDLSQGGGNKLDQFDPFILAIITYLKNSD